MATNLAAPADFIKEITTTTTTGAIQLPNVAAPGYASFSSWYPDGARLPFAINDGEGTWEVGIGTYNDTAHTITRDYTWWSSDNGNSIDFTGKTANVYVTVISGGANLCMQYHWFSYAGAPTVSTDTTTMTDVGSLWISTDNRTFICLDPAAAAAVWTQLLNSLTKIVQPVTLTAGGTTGAQTINKPTGRVNFAASATSLVVTCSECTTSSLVFAEVQSNDTTAYIKNVVPGSGSFTITLGAAATAETKVAFWVIN